MPALRLTHAEVIWLTDSVGQFSQWPPKGTGAASAIPEDRRTDNSLGPLFRLKLLAALRKGMRSVDAPADIDVAVSLEELWFLEAFLSQHPVRIIRIAENDYLISLAIKVWDVLIDEYRSELPENLLSKPADYTGSNAVDEVERFLRTTASRDEEVE